MVQIDTRDFEIFIRKSEVYRQIDVKFKTVFDIEFSCTVIYESNWPQKYHLS